MSTVASKLAEYAFRVDYEDLGAEVVMHTKGVVLDAIGCAFGGYASRASEILRDSIREQAGPREATVIGEAQQASALDATLANGAMVRYLDYNDAYLSPGLVFSGGHPSDIIPAILAVGEAQHSSGKSILASVVAGYELSARFTDGCTIAPPLESRGWNIDLRGGFIVPPVVGKLLGLTSEQVENAMGIAGCRTMLLGIVDAPKEEYTMTKNLRFPWAAHDAIKACYLAKRGFTGPRTIIEGDRGFIQSVMQGDFDVEKATAFQDQGFKIMHTDFKPYVADRTTHGHITATLHLVKEHNILPTDVAQITVYASTRDVEHTGTPEKRYPTNKETADHSSYYLTAIAIKDRSVGPKQFTSDRYTDPIVMDLNNKMTFIADPALDIYTAAGTTEIITHQGKKYRHTVTYPKGDPRNPMSGEELEQKFLDMADPFISVRQAKEIIETIYSLEKLDDIGQLMRLLAFDSH